jgi:hypothetical protein
MSDERWIITDELWDFVEPLIPKTRTSGGSATQGARGFPTARCSAVRPASRRRDFTLLRDC